MKRFFLWITVCLLLCFPVGALAAGETPAPTASPKAGLIPERIDAGLLNALAWDRVVRYRSLTVRGAGKGVLVDVLAADGEMDSAWYGVNTAYLEEQGLTPGSVQPLLDAAPEGWHSLLLLRADDGVVTGSMMGRGDRVFSQSLPGKVRIACYDLSTGQVTVSGPVKLRQYHSLVKVDPAAGRARALTHTASGLFLLKLLLRIVVSAGLTVLALMPFYDRDRKVYFLLRLAGGVVYFLLVWLLHGVTAYVYPLWVLLLQAALVFGESALVYKKLQPGKMYLTRVYALVAYVPAAILGLWWLC